MSDPEESISIVKWIPFISLVFLLVLQTIYFTRYISTLEYGQAVQAASTSDIKAELKSLRGSMDNSIIPNAQTQWRIDQFERQLNDYRKELLELKSKQR